MEEDIIEQGCFYVPHKVFDSSAGLNARERALFMALLALEDAFLMRNRSTKLRRWFNIGNKELCKMVGFSENTLSASRKSLIKRGYIKYKPGYKTHNSDYCILIDNFYLANKYQNKRSTINK